jgi:amidase
VFNFVDYPAVVLPAGKVDRGLDDEAAEDMKSYAPRNPLDEWNWGLFDLESMHGMSIGVQVVARRLQEEKVLGAAKAIDDVLKAPR